MADDTTRTPCDTARGAEHIARYLGDSDRHVCDIRREDETFPAPGRLPGSPEPREEAATGSLGLLIVS
jgi:hypothetical protein